LIEYRQGILEDLQGYICIPLMDEDFPIDLLTQLAGQMDNHALLVHINANEGVADIIQERHAILFEAIVNWLKGTNLAAFICMENAWPIKISGVGNARKYIMDLAADWGTPNSWIAGLDADCMVANNYLTSLDKYFAGGNKAGASIRFEHVLPKEQAMINAITYYEIHLRYLKLGLQYAGFPFYFHTVGSSMVVSVWAYKKCGGMNKRKAGEDFYFLQKVMLLGFGEITDTLVLPSARLSYRVPFGTGRAMQAFMAGNKVQFYPMSAILELREVMVCINAAMSNRLGTGLEWSHKLSDVSLKYLEAKQLGLKWNRISTNAKTIDVRNRNFLQLLSGNVMLLLLNELRTVMPLVVNYKKEVNTLFEAINQPYSHNLLLSLRQAELVYS
jgi:hypothetical protein